MTRETQTHEEVITAHLHSQLSKTDIRGKLNISSVKITINATSNLKSISY